MGSSQSLLAIHYSSYCMMPGSGKKAGQELSEGSEDSPRIHHVPSCALSSSSLHEKTLCFEHILILRVHILHGVITTHGYTNTHFKVHGNALWHDKEPQGREGLLEEQELMSKGQG